METTFYNTSISPSEARKAVRQELFANSRENFGVSNLLSAIQRTRADNHSYLTCLLAHYPGNLSEYGKELFLVKTKELFNCIPPDVYNGLKIEVFQIATTLSGYIKDVKGSQNFLLVLRNFIRRLCPNHDTLTPIHGAFVQSCVISMHFDLAVRELRKFAPLAFDSSVNVHNWNPDEYFLNMGYCYQKNGDFKAAFRLVYSALVLHCNEINASHFPIIKRLKLLSLLVFEKENEILRALPELKYSRVSTRMGGLEDNRFQNQLMVYDNIVQAYIRCNSNAIHSYIEKSSVVFAEDGNRELVDEVLKACINQSFLKLTKAFVRISFSNLANMVAMESEGAAVSHLYMLIRLGKIQASIDEENRIVNFVDKSFLTSNQVDEKAFSAMVLHVQQLLQLNNTVMDMQKSLMTSKSFVQRSLSGAGGISVCDMNTMDFDDDKEME